MDTMTHFNNGDTMTTNRTTAWLLGISVAAISAGSMAHAETVVPAGLAGVEGNSATEGPFEAFGRRYQQVYDASAFSGSPLTITGLRFRADGSVDSPVTTSRGVDGFPVVFNLSTTSAGPDSLSTIFDDNVGSDAAQVFSGTLSLTTGPVGGSPNDFSVAIDFDTPFSYDPSGGNLLLDVSKFSSDIFAAALLLDAEDTPGDPISSLSGLAPDAEQGLADTLGLVTSFVTRDGGEPNVIPTPTALLMGLGLLGTAAMRRRRQIA